MFYSNEAVLVDIRFARICSQASWDTGSMKERHLGKSLYSLESQYKLSTTKSRLVKIVDVDPNIRDISGSTDNELLLLVELVNVKEARSNLISNESLEDYIESLENPIHVDDRFLIACRIQDLIYVDSRFLSIRYNRRDYKLYLNYAINRDVPLDTQSELENNIAYKSYSIGVTEIGFPSGLLTEAETSTDRQSIASLYSEWIGFRSNNKVLRGIHTVLLNAIRNHSLLDKGDSRLDKNYVSRFYLSKMWQALYKKYILTQLSRDIIKYHSCEYCDNIGYNYPTLSPKEGVFYMCSICYQSPDIEIDCDCCLRSVRPRGIISVIDYYSEQLDRALAFKSYGMYLLCGDCDSYFFAQCNKCKTTETVNLKKMRSIKDESERRRYMQSWRSSFEYVMNVLYCTSCADSEYLAKPIRYRELPRKFAGKHNLNRFIGIESEVISEYETVEDYIDCQGEPDYFNIVEDGSLNSGGVEFVTSRPVIGSDISLALKSLRQEHKSAWNGVDESCGIHIHFNALDFGFIELKSLLLIMSRIQDSIYKTLPEYRRGSSYVRKISLTTDTIDKISSLSELVSKYYNMQGESITENKYNGARYIGTNLHARFFLGTVEFRYHEGSTSSKRILDWIIFLNSIMSTSKELNKNRDLYRKIISKKTQLDDILYAISGHKGVEYIESKTQEYIQ